MGTGSGASGTLRLMTRSLLEGYVGIKYRALCTEDEQPPECRELYPLFRSCGERLARHDMAPANGGNMSQRVGEGMVITTSGCNLSQIAPEEVSLVRDSSLERQEVTYCGVEEPSSEAMMHWLIYRDFPGAGAVLHAHDEAATSTAAAGQLRETPREEPYGTVALARLAVDAFHRGDELIVLKNHGYVAMADDLEAATEVVVRMHLKLLELARALT